MRISIAILVVAVLAACASNDAQTSTSGLVLDFEPVPSEPAEQVSLILRNGSEFEVGYNLCTARVSQQRGGQWALVGSRGECTTDQLMLEPGAEASYDFVLPEELEGGSHRFSTRVQVGDTRIEEIYSSTFEMPEPAPADSADAEVEAPAS